jgi:PTS system beta-glucosides-specific IIC component
MTGLHFNLMAVAMSMAGVMQKNVVTHPAFFLTQAAQGAACLAVALKTKGAERKALGLSSAFSDWVPGISEPGMYGITLKYKTPMIASMIGSGIGAFIGGLLNVGSYAGGPPNLFTLSLFINPANGDIADLRNIVICMLIAIIITFILTWFMYKDEKADEIDAKG